MRLKNYLLNTALAILAFQCVAQKGMESYEMSDGSTLNAGDTIVFTGGSLGEQYMHVFFMVGNLQKRKAPFNDAFHTQLIIDHFLKKKEEGEVRAFAVMEVPNQPKWYVWARLEEGIKAKEIAIK